VFQNDHSTGGLLVWFGSVCFVLFCFVALLLCFFAIGFFLLLVVPTTNRRIPTENILWFIFLFCFSRSLSARLNQKYFNVVRTLTENHQWKSLLEKV